MKNMCSHCLDEGYWSDEDKCPKCTKDGHMSPWGVNSCKQCDKECLWKLDQIGKNLGIKPTKDFSKQELKDIHRAITVFLNDISSVLKYPYFPNRQELQGRFENLEEKINNYVERWERLI